MNDFGLRLRVTCGCKTTLMIEVLSAPGSPHFVACPKCGAELPVPGRPLWFVYRAVGQNYWTPTALAQDDRIASAQQPSLPIAV
jgi:hypothetical protein